MSWLARTIGRKQPPAPVPAPESKPDPKLEPANAPAPADANLMRVGRYTIIRKLGEGGMGAVYEALQEGLDRRVALKLLPRTLMINPDFIERFKREAKAVAALNHTNIVTVYDVGEDGGQHFFSMEYVDGESLDARLRREKHLSVQQATDLMLQAVHGLAHAWGKGIIHRDIKPANLMVTCAGVLKIADFGLAKASSVMDSMTLTGTGMGTPYYMSPEQGSNAKAADFRSDIYSLGATFYHLVTGRVPYEGDSPFEVAVKVAMGALTPVRSVNSQVPENLAKVIEKMIAREPAARYQNAGELLGALKVLLPAQSPITPPEPLKTPSPGQTVDKCPHCGQNAEISLIGGKEYCSNCGHVREHVHATPVAPHPNAGQVSPEVGGPVACPHCGQHAEASIIGGKTYCSNCGQVWEGTPAAPPDPNPNPSATAVCPYCAQAVAPDVVGVQKYCSSCGRLWPVVAPNPPLPVPNPSQANVLAGTWTCAVCGSCSPPAVLGGTSYCQDCGIKLPR